MSITAEAVPHIIGWTAIIAGVIYMIATRPKRHSRTTDNDDKGGYQ